jgi:RHS repeat-associated protein
MGLAGHLYDTDTGLVQMHHRYYSPRLGHFLTPDYRTPNIYDPSTFTEPYAYAAGNPMLYWDPDGLAIAFIREGRLEVELSEGDTEEEVFRALSLELGKDNYLFRQFDQRNSQLRRYIAYLIRNAAPGDTIDFSILALINDFAYENLPKEWLGFGSQPAGNHFEYRNLVINQLLAQMESDGGELANEVTGYAPFIRDGKRRVLDTGIDEAKSQLAGAFTGYVLSKGFQFVGPRIVRLFSRNSDSSFDTFVQALRHPSNSPSPEILAQEYLTNLQGSIRSGHFLSRHSPMIDMDDLYRRATKGILPDGTQSFMTNSTRFFNYTHMKEAIEKATRSYRASGISGRYSVTIDMLEDVGEGYYKKTGEYSRARKVVVRFNEYGQPITAFPVLPD